MPLTRRFYTTDAVTLARRLLGQRLVRVLDDGTRLAGLIVETEAYLGAKDMAAHTYGGRRTPRNEAMYLPGGHTYVYFTYGMHYCVNVVAGRRDEPVAVLLRALEPTEGLSRMPVLRGTETVRDLCRGPARLCQALAIDKSLNAIDLCRDSRLFIERARPSLPDEEIGVSARIGVAYAGHWAERPLRFSSGVAGSSAAQPGSTPAPGRAYTAPSIFTVPGGNLR